MKLLHIFLISLLLLVLSPAPALAAPLINCQFIFGGGSSCEQNSPITINELVLNPESNIYVDSLIPSDPQYKAGQTVTFKLTVSNPTNAAINNIEIRDIFPTYINYLDGDGTYDAPSHTLTIMVDQLKSKETRDFIIQGSVVPNDQLPDDQLSRCVFNQGIVKANNKLSQDNGMICLSKATGTTGSSSQNSSAGTSRGGLTIYPPSKTKTTPPTGPEGWSIASLVFAAIMGFYFRNKAKT